MLGHRKTFDIWLAPGPIALLVFGVGVMGAILSASLPSPATATAVRAIWPETPGLGKVRFKPMVGS